MGLSEPSFTVKSARHEPRPPSTTGIWGDWKASKPPHKKRTCAEQSKRRARTWPSNIFAGPPSQKPYACRARVAIPRGGKLFRCGLFGNPLAFAYNQRCRESVYDHWTGPVDTLRELRA